ncbi:hypothetical protein [Streptomyces griseosporeus]|uniref:hypothetical protein n=1 Tax=Streptomyces griseosporeus TaxID=1910 RepID=UPI0036F94AB3
MIHASRSFPGATVLGFAFPKEERAALVASAPEKFSLPAPDARRARFEEPDPSSKR